MTRNSDQIYPQISIPHAFIIVIHLSIHRRINAQSLVTYSKDFTSYSNASTQASVERKYQDFVAPAPLSCPLRYRLKHSACTLKSETPTGSSITPTPSIDRRLPNACIMPTTAIVTSLLKYTQESSLRLCVYAHPTKISSSFSVKQPAKTARIAQKQQKCYSKMAQRRMYNTLIRNPQRFTNFIRNQRKSCQKQQQPVARRAEGPTKRKESSCRS